MCAVYAGRTVVADRQPVTKDGELYRLTKWVFIKDGQTAWVAESGFTPKRGAGTF